ncbi:MAG: metallophosphoesterase [Chloroflexi bacterium]|nr:metallophosphoesterase [Chloroflexota bacterium]
MALFGSKPTRIFFTTDVHGSTVVFKKFINAGKFYEAQVLILGGDMIGKMLVPMVSLGGGRYSANYLGKLYNVEGDELAKLETNFENSGLYPVRLAPEEVQAYKNDPGLVEVRFAELAKERLARWLEIAEDRLRGAGIRCYVQPGNDDPYEVDSAFQPSEIIQNVDGRLVQVDDHHEMISVGAANQTPWHCPRDKSEEELEQLIEKTASQLKNPSQAIFNLHVPPFDTNLDIAPELDDNLTPRLSLTGGFKMTPVGSKAVRKMIEKYQPLIGLHGHIHESRSAQKLGKTMCMNPGSEYGEGVLRGIVLELSRKGLENYTFTQN